MSYAKPLVLGHVQGGHCQGCVRLMGRTEGYRVHCQLSLDAKKGGFRR